MGGKFFEIILETFPTLGEECWAGLSKLHSTWRNILRKNIFFNEVFLYKDFWTLSKKNGFLAENFRSGCQNCILHLHANILMRNICFWKNYISVIIFGVWALSINFLTRLSKLQFICTEENFRWKLFLKKVNFLTLGETFSDSERKFFGEVSKTAFCGSRGLFWTGRERISNVNILTSN